MARIIYLYAHSNHPNKRDKKRVEAFSLNNQSSNRLAINARTDGMVYMLNRMAEQGMIEGADIYIQANSSFGNVPHTKHCNIYVIPWPELNIHYQPGDVILVRGGFKSWIPFLQQVRSKRENWILFYAANTANTRWPFWDIVLDDLSSNSVIVNERYHFAFSKPINEEIFTYKPDIQKKFDICVGASHIHRKKGQFRVVQAAVEYEKLIGKKLKLVMPGGFLRCVTNSLIHELQKSVDLYIPGPLSRNNLCQLYNECRVFVHAGVGGQNDRSLLEALRCGLSSVIVNPSRWAPWVDLNTVAIRKSHSWEPHSITKQIHTQILFTKHLESLKPRDIHQYYNQTNGVDTVCIPKMERLLDFIEDNSEPPPALETRMRSKSIKEWNI